MFQTLRAISSRIVYGLLVLISISLLIYIQACTADSSTKNAGSFVNKISQEDSKSRTVGAIVEEVRNIPTPENADSTIFELLKTELVKKLRDRFGDDLLARVTAAAPVGDAGLVDDLAYNAGSNTITWTYANLGDYDLNGEVGVPDITPIATNYLAVVTAPNTIEEWIDGSGDDEVGIPDITPIATNYLNQVASYRMLTADAEDGTFNPIGEPVLFGETGLFPKTFEVTVPTGVLSYIAVQPLDASGNPGEQSLPIALAAPPSVNNVGPAGGLSGTQIQPVVDVNGTPPFTYEWNFGGGATPNTTTDASPTITLGAAGNYDSYVIVTNDYGYERFDFTLYITDALEPPTVQNMTPDTGETGSVVTFSVEVSGTPPFTYAWDFDGGATPNTSTEAAPQVTLGDPGIYNISITATNAQGEDEASFQLEVTEDGGPAINSIEPQIGGTGSVVRMNPFIEGTPPYDVVWDFGGGATPDTTDIWRPIITLGATGTYDASLQVTDVTGTNTLDFTLTVTDANQSPRAALTGYRQGTYKAAYGEPPLIVDFKADEGSDDPDGMVVQYDWDMDGDGVFELIDDDPQKLGITYDTQGRFPVSVRVTDNDGATDFSTYYVAVGDRVDPEDLGIGTDFTILNVDGNPAMLYCKTPLGSEAGSVKYIRANDPEGTSWGTPVVLIEEMSGMSWGGEMEIVEGRPAVVFDFNDSVYYARAEDAQGTSWSAPFAVETRTTGFNPNLEVVNGYPAIAYEGASSKYLYYVRANDAEGTSWGIPQIVYTPLENEIITGGLSLEYANGIPAIAFHATNNETMLDTVFYVQALDQNGAAWDTPIVLDTDIPVAGVSFHKYLNLIAFDGWNPTVVYPISDFDGDVMGELRGVFANDINGDSWNTPVALDTAEVAEGGWMRSLEVVNTFYYEYDGGIYPVIVYWYTASHTARVKLFVVPHTWELFENGYPDGKNIGTLTSLTTIDFDTEHHLYFRIIGFHFLGKYLYEVLGGQVM